MSLTDQYDFENLVNEAERLVFTELDNQLKEYDNICKCQDCVLDMAAYALNHIKPYYRVSLMGTIYAHSIDSTEYAQQVKKAVKEAIKKVSSNPSHD
ncbi:MAG: late competence development ComFB family protein [Spirochaetales bacterium]|nr:late competence development ComFB family protein [Spirochaetales bacterium]RKX81914.1 MAG: competence protein ComFB [Spirochaetota bacterium]